MSEPKGVAEHVKTGFGNDSTAFELPTNEVLQEWQGTEADKREMSALGRVQQLRRNFRSISIIGLTCTVIGTWETMLSTINQPFTNGGTAGVIWGFLICVFGFSFVYMSIAEMASMAPTSGGQYHWVSEFAPPSAQKFLSYVVGWLCFTGWQCGVTSIAFLAGTIIQGLIVLNDSTYVFHRWHGTLLVIAVSAFCVSFNSVPILAKRLPLVQGLILFLHVGGGLAIIISVWVLAVNTKSVANPEDVFTGFINAGGWNSQGTSFMVGLLTPVVALLGMDCAVHMSEEVRDAGRMVPKAMLYSGALNAGLGFVIVVTLCFTIGNVESVLSSPTGFPFIQIFYNLTQSMAGASGLTIIVVLALTTVVLNEVATASRQLWSFARDKGVPGHRWLSRVNRGSGIPLNAVLVTFLVNSLLALINIGSTAALNAVLALTSVSLVSSYAICITLVLLKRIRGQPLPHRRWSLGKAGLAINVIALCWLVTFYVWMFFPQTTPTTAQTMNWSVGLFVGIMAIAIGYYFVRGHKQYVPPVLLVKREEYDSE